MSLQGYLDTSQTCCLRGLEKAYQRPLVLWVTLA